MEQQEKLTDEATSDSEKESIRLAFTELEISTQNKEHLVACIAQVRDPSNSKTGRKARDWTIQESAIWTRMKEDDGLKGAVEHFPGLQEWKGTCGEDDACNSEAAPIDTECRDNAAIAAVAAKIQAAEGSS